MSAPFDPYYTWLAIPPEDQPPDYYRLLGLRPLEPDLEAITKAAEQRIAHVRSQQAGAPRDVVQKILDELAGAQAVLSNPRRKAVYDGQLSQAMQYHAEEVAQVEAAGGVSPTLGQFVQHIQAEEKKPGRLLDQTGERTGGWTRLAIGGGVTLVVVLLAMVVVLSLVLSFRKKLGPDEAALTFDLSADERDGVALFLGRTRVDIPATGPPICRCKPGKYSVFATRKGYRSYSETIELQAGDQKEVRLNWVPEDVSPAVAARPAEKPRPSEPVQPKEGTPKPTTTPAKEAKPKAVAPTPQPSPPPKESPLASTPPLPVPAVSPAEAQPTPQEPKPAAETPPPKPVAREKLPLPPDAAQQEIAQQLNDAYNLQASRSAEDSLRLARELFEFSSKAQQNPAELFVVLRKTMDLACDGGDAGLAMQAIDRIATSFAVEPVEAKRKILTKFAATANDAARIESLVDSIEQTVQQAVETERYDAAVELAKLAYVTCQKPSGQAWRKRTFDQRADIQRLADQWREFQEALGALKTSADDAQAHFRVGRWYCVNKGDWDQGLPHLARGSDENLKRVAQQELDAAPREPADQVKRGDGWWDVAQQAPDTAWKQALQTRAALWYEKARPNLTSPVMQQKVDNRLKQIHEKS